MHEQEERPVGELLPCATHDPATTALAACVLPVGYLQWKVDSKAELLRHTPTTNRCRLLCQSMRLTFRM
jgi:hypothetical protein